MTDRTGPFDPLSDGAPSTALLKAPKEDGVTPSLAAELLSSRDPARTNLVVVLYDASPDEWMKEWLRRIGTRPADLRIVSVGDSTRSAAARAGTGESPGSIGLGAGATIRPVEDPSNVTELGITINECLTEDGEGERTALYFDSVSALLQWVDIEYAVQFLEILSGRLRRNDRAGVFLVRPDAHDDDTFRTLESVFDTVVTPGESPDPDDDTPTDAVLDVLSDPKRRDALRILFGERELGVEELAARIAHGGGRETGRTATTPEELGAELYHWHLPQLENAGFVEYDEDAGTVALADSTDRLRPYLRIAGED